MSQLTVGPRVALDGVPEGLAAYARVLVREDRDGRRTVRDRRGRLSLRHGVVLVQDLGSEAFDPAVAVELAELMDDEELADVVATADAAVGRSRRGWVFGAGTRVASGWSQLPDGLDSVVALARAGLVELQAAVADGHRLEPPSRWTLSAVGLAAARFLEDSVEARMDAITFAADGIDPEGELAMLVSSDPDPFLAAGTAMLEERGWPAHPSLEAAALAAVDREVLAVARALVGRLPLDRRPLSVLAVEVTGDTHGLDPGRPLAAVADLVIELCRDDAVARRPDEDDEVDEDVTRRPVAPTVARERARDRWDAVGIDTDAFGSTAVVWGLPGIEDHPLGGLLAHGQRHATVVHVGLSTLRASDGGVQRPSETSSGWLFTCENAALLQWASSRSIGTPLVLSGGQPSVATRELLRRAVAAGWRVAVGADFEPGGLAAAATLLSHLGNAAVPWRLSVSDYVEGAGSGPPLPLSTVRTDWDPDLAAVLADRRRRVTEEDRWEVLTDDLGRGHPGGA